MSVPVPNVVGTTGASDSIVSSSMIRYHINPSGQVYAQDPPVITNNVYLSWKGFKPPLTKGAISSRQGQIWRSPTTYSRSAERWTWRPGTLTSEYGVPGFPGYKRRDVYTGVNATGIHVTDVDWPSNVYAEMSNLGTRAAVECMNKINEGKVNFGESLATSRQTVETLASTGGDLLKLLLMVKRRQFSQLPRSFGTYVDQVGRQFLIYKYGWKPLCSDIYETYKEFQKGSVLPHRLSATRVCKGTQGVRTTIYGCPVDGTAALRAKTVLHAEVDSGRLAKANSMGLVNPLSLGWELIPFSFVVDWFVPVGNVLSSLSTGVGLNFIGGSSSSTIEGTLNVTLPVGTGVCRKLGHSRIALPSWPITLKPYAKPLPFGAGYGSVNPFQTEKALAAIALLNQLKAK